jgi:hypothetical protein
VGDVRGELESESIVGDIDSGDKHDLGDKVADRETYILSIGDSIRS